MAHSKKFAAARSNWKSRHAFQQTLPSWFLRHGSAMLLSAIWALTWTAFPITSHAKSEALGSGLRPEPPVPEGISVESGRRSLTIRYEAPFGQSQKEIRFLVIAPTILAARPIILDYALRPSGQTGPKSLSKSDEHRNKELADAVGKAKLVAVEDLGIFRFCRLARVTLYPQSIQLPGKSKYDLTRLSFQLTFPQAVSKAEALPEFTEANRGFALIFRHLVANPDAVSLYARRDSEPDLHAQKSQARPSPAVHSQKWLKVMINQDGIYKISQKALANLTGTERPRIESLRIYSRGQEVPLIRIQGSGPSPEPMVIFYGRGSNSKYSTARAYWTQIAHNKENDPLPQSATIAAAAQNSFSTTDTPYISAPHTYRFEEDLTLQIEKGNFLSIKSSNWIWKEISSRSDEGIGFDLRYLNPDSAVAPSLAIHLHTSPNQTSTTLSPIEVWVNQTLVGKVASLAYISKADTLFRFTVSLDVLKESGNMLSLRFSHPIEKDAMSPPVFLDHFEVRADRYLVATDKRLDIEAVQPNAWYKMTGFSNEEPILFDCANPEAPLRIPLVAGPSNTWLFRTGATSQTLLAATMESISEASALLPVSDDKGTLPLASPSNAADYLIIHHALFARQAEQLAALRRRKGLQAKTVDVESIYRAYSYGELTPLAIKDFLRDALRYWRIPPTYVCLFGDATSDYRGALRAGVPNLVPAYSVDAESGDTWASELWYATIAGADLLPDLLLGRLAAQNEEDANELVRKIADYGASPALGPWRSRMGFCADSGPFRPAVERLRRSHKPRGFGSTQIFLDDMPWEDEFYLPRQVVKENNIKVSTPSTLRLLDTFDRGVAMFLFFGHGSPNIWTDQRIWFGGNDERSDNLNLRNENRLPFVATFTCNQGAFDYPMPPWDINISEDMMRVKGRGSIAMFVPSGPGDTASHETMAQGLLEAVFREKLRRLGEVSALARIYYQLRNGPEHIQRMYLLLGDPALELAIPAAMQEGQITPSSVNRLDLPKRSSGIFAGQAEGIMHGNFSASLYDPNDNLVLRSEKTPFYSGKINWRFNLPENATEGQWTVRIYYGNDRMGKDGILYGSMEIARPELRIEGLEWEAKASEPGRQAVGAFDLVNGSGIAAIGVPVDIAHFLPDGSERVLQSTMETLGAGQRKRMQFRWMAESGIHSFKVVARRYQQPVDESRQAQAEASIVAYVADISASSSLPQSPCLIPATALVQANWRSLVPEVAFSATVPIFYHHSTTTQTLLCHLSTEDGNILSSSSVLLRPTGLQEIQMTTVTFPVRVPSPAYAPVLADNRGSLRLLAQATGIPDRKNTALLDAPLQIGPPRLPDLALIPESIQFQPSAPVEGETIFLRAMVTNCGYAASTAFRLEVFAISEGNADELLKSRGGDSGLFEPLAPGRRRSVEIRWDYDAYRDYAGLNRLRIQVSPQVTTTLQREVSLENNSVETSLRVLRRPTLETDIQKSILRDLPDGRTECSVRVRIHNTGEAPATGQLLGFYSRIPVKHDDYLTTGFLQSQLSLPILEGNEEKVFTHTWTIRNRDANTSPTARVYRITRSIRGREISLKPFVREW